MKIVSPDSADKDISVTFRVTDDDGLTSSHVRHIEVSRSHMRTSIPIAMPAPKVAEVGGFFYVFDSNSKRVFAYDPKSRKWTEKSPRSATRLHFATLALNGKIYLVGGEYGDDVVEAFDPAANHWEVKASMHFKRRAEKILIVGGRIMSISGGSQSGYSLLNDTVNSTAEIYDDVPISGPSFPIHPAFSTASWYGPRIDSSSYPILLAVPCSSSLFPLDWRASDPISKWDRNALGPFSATSPLPAILYTGLGRIFAQNWTLIPISGPSIQRQERLRAYPRYCMAIPMEKRPF